MKIEATGKTIDEAISNGLEMLGGIDRDLVSVEILENPKSGFLGIGSTPAKVSLSYEAGSTDKVKSFLEGLFEKMQVSAQVATTVDEENGTVSVDLSGENMGVLIGRRGETLDAIQHITNLVANHGEDKHIRVMIDTENYREKREEALTRLAHKIAGQAKKYRRNKVLEPMNAYERHVIHAALQDVEHISTSSTGVEPNRRVVVTYTGPQDSGRRRSPRDSSKPAAKWESAPAEVQEPGESAKPIVNRSFYRTYQ